MRFYHVAWNRLEVLVRHNKEDGLKGGGPLPIYWYISLMCMDCYQGNKVVSLGVCCMGITAYEWFHSWWGGIT